MPVHNLGFGIINAISCHNNNFDQNDHDLTKLVGHGRSWRKNKQPLTSELFKEVAKQQTLQLLETSKPNGVCQ